MSLRLTHVLVLLALLFGGPSHAAPAGPVQILIDSPQSGQVVRNKVHQAPIQGNALAEGEQSLDFDVMLVIDVSGSTKVASGADVDGDGEVGINPQQELVPAGLYPADVVSTDPQDTILAAEVKAADALIGSLDPGRVRVGVVIFSGEMNLATGHRLRWDQQDAWVEVPLTADLGYARSRLPGILSRGPHGGTNFAAGMRLAITELAGLTGAKSAPRPDVKKVILFLTDGLPTFPIGSGSVADAGDTEAALSSARLAHKAGIVTNTYALGSSALSNPLAVTEMARLTRGTFMPVRKPGDIISFLQGVSFADIEDVVFTNLTTREVSYDVDLSADGSFSGFVPVREGVNRVRVTALSSTGAQASVELDLEFQTSGLSSRELTLELERIRERNKQLILLIVRDRVKRFREQQRKELELEIGEIEE